MDTSIKENVKSENPNTNHLRNLVHYEKTKSMNNKNIRRTNSDQHHKKYFYFQQIYRINIPQPKKEMPIKVQKEHKTLYRQDKQSNSPWHLKH